MNDETGNGRHGCDTTRERRKRAVTTDECLTINRYVSVARKFSYEQRVTRSRKFNLQRRVGLVIRPSGVNHKQHEHETYVLRATYRRQTLFLGRIRNLNHRARG